MMPAGGGSRPRWNWTGDVGKGDSGRYVASKREAGEFWRRNTIFDRRHDDRREATVDHGESRVQAELLCPGRDVPMFAMDEGGPEN